MIITRLRGGLGNQMFQYALGRVLSIQKNEELKLDISGYKSQARDDTYRAYKLRYFNIEGGIATDEEVQKVKYPLGIISKAFRAFKVKVLRKFYIDYHPEILDKKIKYLDGFFQSEKYYPTQELRDIIRNDFQLKEEFKSPAMKATADLIQATGQTSISIHIRRGDYVTNKAANSAQGVCSINYYEAAINEMQAKLNALHNADTKTTENSALLHFFIFSDDIEWVKANLSTQELYPASTTTYVSSPALADYEELTLMSHCKNHIIGNSTFSWWGAWLNPSEGKVILAPKQWTVRNTENPNIIPSDWIRV